MTHWGDNYHTVGRFRTATTQVTETRMKSAVKTKARKTNNQASFGQSLLKNNMEVEAAMELSRHLDETGSPLVCMLGCLVNPNFFLVHPNFFLCIQWTAFFFNEPVIRHNHQR